MHVAYKLVVVNIIASLCLLGGVLFYKFIYPKKKINLLALLILISLLPLLSMLRTGTYQSGDLSLHAIRTMSFYKILFSEHIIPFWTPEFYGGYGDPYFGFAYFLPYFIGSVFHFIGISFLASLKLLMAISFVLSGIFMYLFVKNEMGEKAAFTAGIFYLFFPYHLINMHFQVTIAQTLSYLFLPLNLYLTRKIFVTHGNSKWLISLSFSEMLLILSHQVISLSFLPINIIYAFYLTNKLKAQKIVFLKYLASICMGVILSAFYWLPIVFNSHLTQQSNLKNSILFPSLPGLIFSPWRYGLLFQGPKGELSYLIGYTQLIVLIVSIVLFFRKKIDKKFRSIFTLFYLISLVLLFFISPFSKPLWYIIPFLNLFQFSTRLLVPLSVCISIIAGILVISVKKQWFFILLCSSTVLYTILNWGNRTTIPTINDKVLMIENKTWPSFDKGVGLEPSSPIWANLNKELQSKKRPGNIIPLTGNVSIKQLTRTSIEHKYLINVKSYSSEIRENTLYFPGWTLTVDGSIEKINYLENNNKGLIIFKLSKGIHKVDVVFIKTQIRKISDLISLLGIFFLFLFTFINLIIIIRKHNIFVLWHKN